eukprot:CAMPEP_0119298626 /NCGR_PEP_ID=MMETSP1333-20130426/780_1 /TAXON_ID=418940 /ORGANISM="Scyphosphaera apsteinii, Strain RCC1455" /LENGTH=247 /DNA_ID=CAMNT_0007299783 /DNA_START=201 /DNA_END=941 /DNA_ORIENTATION=-
MPDFCALCGGQCQSGKPKMLLSEAFGKLGKKGQLPPHEELRRRLPPLYAEKLKRFDPSRTHLHGERSVAGGRACYDVCKSVWLAIADEGPVVETIGRRVAREKAGLPEPIAPKRTQRGARTTEIQLLCATSGGSRHTVRSVLEAAGGALSVPLVDGAAAAHMTLRSRGGPRRLAPDLVDAATADGTQPPSVDAIANIAEAVLADAGLDESQANDAAKQLAPEMLDGFLSASDSSDGEADLAGVASSE